MPDHIDPIPAVQGRADWPAMLHDLEKRVETLSDALDGVKLSMRRLVLAEPWIENALSHNAAGMPIEPGAHIQTPAPVESPLPIGVLPHASYEVVPSLDPEPIARYEPEAAPAERPPTVYDENAREAVRQAVEDSKTHLPDWRQAPVNYVTEDKPGVSWVTLPDKGDESEPLAVTAAELPEDVAIGSLDSVGGLPETPDAVAEPVASVEDDEAAREAVRRAVEEAKAELGVGAASNAELAATIDDETSHSAVRQSVDETMIEEAEAEADAPVTARSESDDEAAREAVRRAVEESKAAMGYAPSAAVMPAAPAGDEEAQREAVRQAVAQARAEMHSTGSLFEASKPVEKAPAFVVPPPHRAERVHPPTLTIEDPEGRVELARVYNLLKRLDCAANSSLLNYSSRQVSVQLSDSRTAPDGEQVRDAVTEVFERENDVQVDGVNIIVKLGNDQVKAA